ncbi:sigma-54 dependent transcriptional regulator [Bdellovibrionota bacterium FG-1]
MREIIQQNLKILAVDDDPAFCRMLRELYAREFDIQSVGSASETLQSLSRTESDLLLLDIQLPDLSGLDLLKLIHDRFPKMPVIMLTGNVDLKVAISAIKSGAFDYVTKGTPDFVDELRARILLAQRHIGLLDRTKKLEQRVNEQTKKYRLIGDSPAMMKLRSHMLALRGRDASVVITGESGVGKEVVARNLSFQDGLTRPFMAVNCGAIPENLVESELFGHEKGSFTGATQKKTGLFVEANGGDLFLDEIGELPLSMQAKLLRALQERLVRPVGAIKDVPIRVRIIAATNRDLKQEVREGRFREDLYYRLSVMTLTIPPLRDHPEDIPALVSHILTDLGAHAFRVSEEAMNRIKRYRWPGNVRALKNCLERAVLLLQGTGQSVIKVEHILLDDTAAGGGPALIVPQALLPVSPEEVSEQSYKEFLHWAEQLYFDHAFLAAEKNKTHLAGKLKLSRDFVHRKLKSLGIGIGACASLSDREDLQ